MVRQTYGFLALAESTFVLARGRVPTDKASRIMARTFMSENVRQLHDW